MGNDYYGFPGCSKKQNPHNKNTCVVSIKLELDKYKKSAVTSPCLLDKKGEGVCLIVKQKRLEISISIYNDILILNVPAHLAALLASKKTSHPLTLLHVRFLATKLQLVSSPKYFTSSTERGYLWFLILSLLRYLTEFLFTPNHSLAFIYLSIHLNMITDYHWMAAKYVMKILKGMENRKYVYTCIWISPSFFSSFFGGIVFSAIVVT